MTFPSVSTKYGNSKQVTTSSDCWSKMKET